MKLVLFISSLFFSFNCFAAFQSNLNSCSYFDEDTDMVEMGNWLICDIPTTEPLEDYAKRVNLIVNYATKPESGSNLQTTMKVCYKKLCNDGHILPFGGEGSNSPSSPYNRKENGAEKDLFDTSNDYDPFY